MPQGGNPSGITECLTVVSGLATIPRRGSRFERGVQLTIGIAPRRRTSRWIAALGMLVIAAGVVGTGSIALASSSGEAANINQCRNGSPTSHVACIQSTGAWQNGNLGATNSHYRENDSVPFQVLLTGMGGANAGTHTLDINWAETASSKHAYDYLTSFDRTETTANACAGFLGFTAATCTAGHSTITIGADPNLAGCAGFVGPQVAGVIDVYGASGTSLVYFNTPSSCQGASNNGSAHINFSTTSGQNSVILAWGGHVASQIDWGLGNSASAISGSPYHMAVSLLDGASTGSQDRSIKAAAILPVPTIATSADGASGGSVPTVSSGTSFTDTVTLTGDSTHGAVTGTVSFFMCFNASAATACTSGGTAAGAGIVLTTHATTPPTSTATSSSVSPTATGYYCFRVVYTPDATAGYSPGQSTVTTNECVQVVTLNTSTTSTPQTSDTESGTFTDATSAAIGSWIRDKAVVSDTTTPTGTIAFSVCGPTLTATACTSGGTTVAENSGAKTSNSTSVTFYSASFQPATAGFYCFAAAFTGTGAFQDSHDSSTGECIEILPASPALSTTPSAVTSFSATLSDSADVGPGNNPGGSVRFRLYDTLANCNLGGTSVGSGGLLYEETVSFTANGNNTRTVSTTGTGSGSNVVTTAGTYQWLAHYSGDTNNEDNDSACGDEAETVTASTVNP
jgi:hypothetical protein